MHARPLRESAPSEKVVRPPPPAPYCEHAAVWYTPLVSYALGILCMLLLRYLVDALIALLLLRCLQYGYPVESLSVESGGVPL